MKKLILCFLGLTIFISVFGKNYQYIEPKSVTVPESLRSENWSNHLKNEILPFWTTAAALGTPEGNYPTNRRNNGTEFKGDTTRYTRMIGRQIYVYSMGYMMTGDEKLLQYAKSGINWLTKYGKDNVNGGWHAILDKKGRPDGEYDKYTQDLAYVAMGFAAYYFVTRDAEAERELIGIRNLIFSKYWDEKNKRVLDGLDYKMKKEVDQEGGGWELVAQLDQINGYLMLTQPILSEESNRKLFLNDIKILSETLLNEFYSDGIFWGQKDEIGKFGRRHVDYGHTLKSYWMILQADKRLKGEIVDKIFEENMSKKLKSAFVESKGYWTDEITDYESSGKGAAMWWSYAECEQLAATLNLEGGEYTPLLEKTAKSWDRFVDKKDFEVYTNLGYGDKAGVWKNGFHSTEHSLVMYIHGKYLEKKEVELYFAVPVEDADTFIAVPYIFNGKETKREELNEVKIEDRKLTKVRVYFKNIY